MEDREIVDLYWQRSESSAFHPFPHISAFGSGFGSGELTQTLTQTDSRENAEKVTGIDDSGHFSGCGGRIRTNDLRVMSSQRSVFYHFPMW